MADRANLDDERFEAELLQRRLFEIERALEKSLPHDSRFDSGMPAEWVSDSESFVRLAGITRRGAVPQTAEAQHANAHELTFHEPGVADVDSASGPGGLETEADDVVQPATGAPSRSVAEFKSLIEDLERAAHASDTDAAMAAPLSLPEISADPSATELEEDESPGGQGLGRDTPRDTAAASRVQFTLAEAEQLLQELEHQERDSPGPDSATNPPA